MWRNLASSGKAEVSRTAPGERHQKANLQIEKQRLIKESECPNHPNFPQTSPTAGAAPFGFGRVRV